MGLFSKKDNEIRTDNYYIRSQILTAISYLNNFLVSCRSAASQDDGIIDAGEQKALDEIERITKEYQERLKEITK